ncbi:MAG: hypothetical protein ACOYLK_12600 [Sphingomonas sp.]|jgi:hypothetical protein
MNPFEMVVMIVAIVMIASVVRARYGVTRDKHGNEVLNRPDPESGRMKQEIAQLKERIAVLERLATDDNGARQLDREIEKLR